VATEPVREEAERLVAAAIWAVTSAARGLGAAAREGGGGRSGGFATGSPECCVCPVCRVVATMRDPTSDLAERLATGAGDLAVGVTGLLRAFAGRDSDETRGRGPGATHGQGSGPTRDGDGVASHDGDGLATDDGDGVATDDGDNVWEAMRRRARDGWASSYDPWRAATSGGPPPPPDAVASDPVASDHVAPDPVAQRPVAKKAMAKKAMAKKAVAKKVVVKKVTPPSEGE
jgi:hypothetical protein